MDRTETLSIYFIHLCVRKLLLYIIYISYIHQNLRAK